MKDKRKYPRRYLLAQVRLKTSKSGPGTNSVAVNISKGGISIYTKKALKVKDKVRVKITVMIRGKETVSEEVPGVVRWVMPVAGQYAAGIRFNDVIDKKRFPVLARCIEYAYRGIKR